MTVNSSSRSSSNSSSHSSSHHSAGHAATSRSATHASQAARAARAARQAQAKRHTDSFTHHHSKAQARHAATHVAKVHGVPGVPEAATVAGCAKYLLNSPNVKFWNGLSTGSDRANMQRLANGEKALVNHTGALVTPKLSMMQSLVAMAQKGPIQINALTGGEHSKGSNHYRGTAVDLATNVGNTRSIVATANDYGGNRNSETSHIHLNF